MTISRCNMTRWVARLFLTLAVLSVAPSAFADNGGFLEWRPRGYSSISKPRSLLSSLCGGFSVGGVSMSIGNCSSGAEGAYWDSGGTMESLACGLLQIPQGGVGAILMVVAGIVAVAAAALGSYKGALATLIVGVGAWAIYPVTSLFFGDYCGFSVGVGLGY